MSESKITFNRDEQNLSNVDANNESTKQKIIFIGITKELIDNIVKGQFANYHLLAAVTVDTNIQGRVLPHPNGLLFTVKPEEFSRFNYDLIVVSGSSEDINSILTLLINSNIETQKIRVFNSTVEGMLLPIKVQRNEIDKQQ